MSFAQNLSYTAVQALHNWGAVTAVGGSFAGIFLADWRRKIALAVLCGWGLQGISGAAFGAVSYHYMHRFPDIGDTATHALYLKMFCAAAGFLLVLFFLLREKKGKEIMVASFFLAFTAITSAAVLRWFS